MFLSGLYFGFYNQLKRTLSSIVGLAASIFVSDILVGVISGLGNIKDIIAKVVNVFFAMEANIALKLVVSLMIFLIVKLIMFVIIGAFKKRDVKSFLKDKTLTSCLIGGTLGLINAYIVGLVLYILFLNIPGSLTNANVSSRIFYILPHIKQLIDAILLVE